MRTVVTGAATPDELAALAINPEPSARMQAMLDYIAVRTVFLNQFFLYAADRSAPLTAG